MTVEDEKGQAEQTANAPTTTMVAAVPEATGTPVVVTDPPAPQQTVVTAGGGGAVISKDPDHDFGPRNRWKQGLCSCFDICCTPLCCMAFWCNIIVVGQIMQRMGLDWCGTFDKNAAKNTFSTVLIIFAVYLILACFGIGGLFAIPYIVYYIIISIKARSHVRQEFGIPSEYCHCCDGQLEDCCCMCWCGCCATIQLERHTHDENQYPYEFTAPTGKPSYTPVIYESPRVTPGGGAVVSSPEGNKVEDRV